MIIGLGCDIVKIKRFFSWCGSKKLLHKIFASSEISLLPAFVGKSQCVKEVADNALQRASEQLAGMFAAKEAYKKAVSTSYKEIVFMKDIIIEKNQNGAPRFRLERSARKALVACAASHAFVSISHEKEYAIATVVLG